MAQHQTEKSIVLCLDFDGTLTNLEGSQLVYGVFYQSLLKKSSGLVVTEYKTSPLRDNIQALFQAQFGEKFDSDTSYAKDMASALISKAALLFL